jgi:hypothetical protein
MTDRSLGMPQPEQPDGFEDPTRDIRLPPVPGSPAAHLPAEWAGAEGTPATEAPHPEAHVHEPPLQPIPVQELPAQPPPVAGASVVEPAVTASRDATVVLEPATDHLPPVVDVPRHQTRPFGAPSDQAVHTGTPEPDRSPPHRPVREESPNAAPPAARGGTWTWVLLVVLPIVIIAAAGVLLYFLLSGG